MLREPTITLSNTNSNDIDLCVNDSSAVGTIEVDLDVEHNGAVTMDLSEQIVISKDYVDLLQMIQELAASKVDKEDGKGLVHETDVEKLHGIEDGAQANVQSDWDEIDISSDSYIKNKLSEITNAELEALLV